MTATQIIGNEGVAPGLGRVVLVVDDDPIQRKLVGVQLDEAGFVVDTASGALEAQRCVARRRPDIILCDVLMDEMDGFSLCRHFRLDHSLDNVPIILLSAYFNEIADRTLANEVGANALIERRPRLQQVIEMMVRVLAETPALRITLPPSSELHARRVAHRLALFQKENAEVEARYQTLFEHANDAISILTPEGAVLDVNRRWEAIMKRPREELRGLSVRDFSAPGAEEENARKYAASVRSEFGKEGPVPIRRADGSVAYMEFTTTTLDMHGEQRVLAIGRDMTDLVESRKELEASERKYRTLVENIPEVLWSANGVRLTFITSNALGLFGFSADEMLAGDQCDFFARVHPDDLVRFRSAMDRTLTEQVSLDVECRWQHRDGTWIWVHCRALPACAEDGTPGVDGIFSDISGRKRLEEQVLQSQKVEVLGQVAAGLAHDFNNILAVVNGNSEYLREVLEKEENRIVVDELLEASKRGRALTSQLLAFGRRELNEPRPVDLNQLVKGVETLLSRTLGSRRTLAVVPGADLGTIHADPRHLEQVLMNLVINARDAMPDSGTVTLTTSNVDVSETDAAEGLPSAGRYVALSVRDNGSGMDAATKARLFEPFFTTKARGHGTGLGLSTSYGIVRRYGGTVVVDSKVGVGTVFTIYFPRIEEMRALVM